jgi:hypothetical protein
MNRFMRVPHSADRTSSARSHSLLLVLSRPLGISIRCPLRSSLTHNTFRNSLIRTKRVARCTHRSLLNLGAVYSSSPRSRRRAARSYAVSHHCFVVEWLHHITLPMLEGNAPPFLSQRLSCKRAWGVSGCGRKAAGPTSATDPEATPVYPSRVKFHDNFHHGPAAKRARALLGRDGTEPLSRHSEYKIRIPGSYRNVCSFVDY